MPARQPGNTRYSTTSLAALVLALALAPLVMAQTKPDPAPQPNAAPRLEVSTAEWNIGERWAGEKAEGTIKLTNAGTAPLKIDKVKSDCGCTTARLTKKLLQPGESVSITVGYNTLKRKENVLQRIRIWSNDPASPITTIRVTGRVRQVVKLDPPRGLSFGGLQRDASTTKTVAVECTYDKPLMLTLVDETPEYFDVRLDEVEKGRRYKLEIVTRPPLPDGSLKGRLELRTGLTDIPKVPVYISGFVQPRVSCVPKVLAVSSKWTEPVQRVVRLTHVPGHTIKVTAVEVSHPEITFEIISRDKEVRAKGKLQYEATDIRVTLPPGVELPDKGAAVTIKTDDREYPEFVVPIRTVAPKKRPGTIPAKAAADKKTTAGSKAVTKDKPERSKP